MAMFRAQTFWTGRSTRARWTITITKAENKLGVTRTGDRPGLPGNNNYKVFEAGAKALGYTEVHTGRMAINSDENRDRMMCQQTGFCFQGCKWGAKWSAALYRHSRGRSDRQSGSARAVARGPHSA